MQDMSDAKPAIMKPVAVAILITMLTGGVTAIAGMYMDISTLKFKDKTLTEKVDTIGSDVKEIKWFLIEQNGGNIDRKNGSK